MVHFDQAFIPVYYHVWKGDMMSARSAVFNLVAEWEQLQHHTQKILPEDVDWQESFLRTDVWLDDAISCIDDHHQEYALAELDHVRYELTEIRRFKGIPYYLDDLYDFQANTEELYDVASDDMLCLLEWREFEILVENLEAQWTEIQNKPLDKELFEINKVETGRLQMMYKMIAIQMKDIVVDLNCGNQFGVAEKTKKLETIFMKTLCSFGKFPEAETARIDI